MKHNYYQFWTSCTFSVHALMCDLNGLDVISWWLGWLLWDSADRINHNWLLRWSCFLTRESRFVRQSVRRLSNRWYFASASQAFNHSSQQGSHTPPTALNIWLESKKNIRLEMILRLDPKTYQDMSSLNCSLVLPWTPLSRSGLHGRT